MVVQVKETLNITVGWHLLGTFADHFVSMGFGDSSELIKSVLENVSLEVFDSPWLRITLHQIFNDILDSFVDQNLLDKSIAVSKGIRDFNV